MRYAVVGTLLWLAAVSSCNCEARATKPGATRSSNAAGSTGAAEPTAPPHESRSAQPSMSASDASSPSSSTESSAAASADGSVRAAATSVEGVQLRRIRVQVWDQYAGRFREPEAARGERITRSANAPLTQLLVIVDATVGRAAQHHPVAPIALVVDEGAWTQGDGGLQATFASARRVFSSKVKPNMVFEGSTVSVPFLIQGRRCEPVRLRATLDETDAEGSRRIEETVEIDCGE